MKIKDEMFYKTVRDFLGTYLVGQKNYSRNTQRAYKLAFSQLLDYLSEKLGIQYSKIGFEHLTYNNICGYTAWLEKDRSCGIQTVNQRLMAIRSFTKYASTVDPANIHIQVQISNVPRKKVPVKVVDHMSEAVLENLFKQPNLEKPNGRRDQFFMILMYDVAARCRELLELKICDVDLGKNASVLLTRKGGKRQSVPVSEDVAAHFAEYLKWFHPQSERSDGDYVFYTVIHGVKQQMSPDAVAAFMKGYAAKCRTVCPETPARVHPHMLRHSRAMHLYRAGMPLVLISEFLGYADVNTTRIYAWADTEMKRQAIKAVSPESNASVSAIWESNEDMIKRLYGIA
jgi:site-specific recombinase XerD